MQAKGKLPRTVTEASERHDEVYHETEDRIFPGPAGKMGVLDNMIKDSTRRIDAATAGGRGGNASDIPANAERAHDVAMMGAAKEYKKQQRQELKNKLRDMENQINEERIARLQLQHKLQEAREGGPSQ